MMMHTTLGGLSAIVTLTNYTVQKSIPDVDNRVDGSSASGVGSRDWFGEHMAWHRQTGASCSSNHIRLRKHQLQIWWT